MSKFIPVSKNEHADKFWVAPRNYAFAAKQALIPIVNTEAAKAAVSMPLGFVKNGNMTECVAVASPESGDNLFVAVDGRWLGGHVPLALRIYPFRLRRLSGAQDMALCVAEEAVSDQGEPIYGADGALAPSLNAHLAALQNYESSRQRTLFAAQALHEAGVLTPWRLKYISAVSGEEKTLEGVMRVDDKALNALDESAFIKLRKVNALFLAYAQMTSASRFRTLVEFAAFRRRQSGDASRTAEPALDFLYEDEETIRF